MSGYSEPDQRAGLELIVIDLLRSLAETDTKLLDRIEAKLPRAALDNPAADFAHDLLRFVRERVAHG